MLDVRQPKFPISRVLISLEDLELMGRNRVALVLVFFGEVVLHGVD
jgi:hypothetical protein